MISVLERGVYSLIETKMHTKILMLDGKQTFAWVAAGDIGEILVSSHKKHIADYILAMGNYRIYDVQNEIYFSDQQHLELHVGLGMWQGYILPTGLPTNKKRRNRIIPTHEIITLSNEEANPPVHAIYAR